MGGQQMDLSAAPGRSTAAEVDEIELRKTAALLASCARMGAILGGGSPAQVDALGEYGTRLGLLFQVTDDILDETGSFEEMGKGIAKDRARGKWTYPVAHGMPAAIERASELERAALDALSRVRGGSRSAPGTRPHGAEQEDVTMAECSLARDRSSRRRN